MTCNIPSCYLTCCPYYRPISLLLTERWGNPFSSGLEDANTDVREPVKYPEEMVIVHFLEKLDMSRYARLKQDYDNGLIARFGSLSDAYENVVIILLFTTNTKQSRSD